MATPNLYDLVIIGGGPGGLTAGIYAMRAVLQTVLIEKGLPGGQMTSSDIVENWPGTKNISGMELSQNILNHAESYGLDIVAQEVMAVEPGQEYHTVRLANGEVYHSHAIIIATGGSPRKMAIPGESENLGKGVSYCAVCDGFFFRDKTVVVIGGGDTATEEALYLAKLAKQVFLIHRRDTLRAGMILQQRVKNNNKIEIVWNTIAAAINPDDNGVASVTLKNTQTNQQRVLNTDGVFIFIGFEPNNQLVPAGTPMNADGYVMTDQKCETSTPGIYVIGDLRQKYAKQIVVACGEGATAALSAAHYVETKKKDN